MAILIKSNTPDSDKDFWATSWQAFSDAEARRNQELANPCRRTRATDMTAAKRRWDLEEEQEMRRIERQHREIWE